MTTGYHKQRLDMILKLGYLTIFAAVFLQAPSLNEEELRVRDRLISKGSNLEFVMDEPGWVLSLDVNRKDGNFDFSSVKTLRRLSALRVLSGKVKEGTLAQLKNCPDLYLLVLIAEITDEGMRSICNLQNLTKLDVMGPITKRGLAFLVKLKKLERLYLYNTTLTDADLAPLGQLTQLKVLTLPKSVTESALARLRTKLPKAQIDRM